LARGIVTALATRLAELDITPTELAAIVRRPLSTVEEWIKDGPDASARILLRFLDDDHVAALAVERVRGTVTQSWRGDSAEHTGISPEQLADNVPLHRDGGRPQ
jgi:hypothetical protein